MVWPVCDCWLPSLHSATHCLLPYVIGYFSPPYVCSIKTHIVFFFSSRKKRNNILEEYRDDFFLSYADHLMLNELWFQHCRVYSRQWGKKLKRWMMRELHFFDKKNIYRQPISLYPFLFIHSHRNGKLKSGDLNAKDKSHVRWLRTCKFSSAHRQHRRCNEAIKVYFFLVSLSIYSDEWICFFFFWWVFMFSKLNRHSFF